MCANRFCYGAARDSMLLAYSLLTRLSADPSPGIINRRKLARGRGTNRFTGFVRGRGSLTRLLLVSPCPSFSDPSPGSLRRLVLDRRSFRARQPSEE